MQSRDTDPSFSRKPAKTEGWLAFLACLIFAFFCMAMAIVFRFPPSEHSFYPACGVYQATGLFCPGCGGFRAWHELLHGRLLNALHMNALAVTLIPGVALWVTIQPFLKKNGDCETPRLNPRFAFFMIVIVLSFSVLRNLPWVPFCWLAPIETRAFQAEKP